MKEKRLVTYGMVDLDCGSGQEGSSSRSSALCPSDGARRLSLPMIQASRERIHQLVIVARDLDSELTRNRKLCVCEWI